MSITQVNKLLLAILFHCVVDIGMFKGIPPIDKLGQNKAIIPCVGLGETALRDSDQLNIPYYISTLVVSASDHPFSHCCHFVKVQPEHIASPAELKLKLLYNIDRQGKKVSMNPNWD